MIFTVTLADFCYYTSYLVLICCYWNVCAKVIVFELTFLINKQCNSECTVSMRIIVYLRLK